MKIEMPNPGVTRLAKDGVTIEVVFIAYATGRFGSFVRDGSRCTDEVRGTRRYAVWSQHVLTFQSLMADGWVRA